MYMLCSYTTFALVVDIEKMNMIQMLLAVITTCALVRDLEQHSCSMARTYKFQVQWFVPYGVSNFIFFRLYLKTLKKPWSESGIIGRWILTDLTKLSLDLGSSTKNFIIFSWGKYLNSILPCWSSLIHFAAVSIDIVHCSSSSGLSTILSRVLRICSIVLSTTPDTNCKMQILV